MPAIDFCGQRQIVLIFATACCGQKQIIFIFAIVSKSSWNPVPADPIVVKACSILPLSVFFFGTFSAQSFPSLELLNEHFASQMFV